jgi:hypothetical protein
MKRFSTVISIPAIIFFALSCFPAQSNGAPALSLSVAEEHLIVHKPYQHVVRCKQKEKKAGHTAALSHTHREVKHAD